MTTRWTRGGKQKQSRKKDIGRFRLFLHRGINTMHKLLCILNTAWKEMITQSEISLTLKNFYDNSFQKKCISGIKKVLSNIYLPTIRGENYTK